jgi:hypothetical protein
MPVFLLLSLHNACRVKTVQQIEASIRAADIVYFNHWHPLIVVRILQQRYLRTLKLDICVFSYKLTRNPLLRQGSF